jgi:hypothetical protein
MSDYFLNRIYDSLLTNKQPKTKSTFRTLSESYGLVCEEETENALVGPNQSTITNTPEGNQSVQQDNKREQNQTNILIDINQPVLQTTRWVGIQQELYNKDANKDDESKTGVGPGEYAIASVISGITEKNALQNFISGQSESFDVSWPSKDDPKNKFEVKKEEGSSVRVGKLGHTMGGYIQRTVLSIADTLQQEYNRLNDDSKLNVDDTIKNKMSRVIGTKKIKGSQETGFRSEEKERKQYMDSRIDNWNLSGYINAITSNIIELPKNLLFGDETNKNYRYYNTDYRYSDSRNPNRKQYSILSLKKLLQIIENIANTGGTSEDTATARELATTFKQFYNIPSTEKGKEFESYLDQEAAKIDRQFSKQLCKTTGEGCKNMANFFTSIKQEGLYQDLLAAEEYINNPTNIRQLFPDEITGLFVVNSQGWKYVPANQIGELIRIDTISQGRPKITLAGTPSSEEV